MQIYVVFHGNYSTILANFFSEKHIYIRNIKSNKKPLRTILLNLVGVNFKEEKGQSQKRLSNFFSFLAWSFFGMTLTTYHKKDLVESL